MNIKDLQAPILVGPPRLYQEFRPPCCQYISKTNYIFSRIKKLLLIEWAVFKDVRLTHKLKIEVFESLTEKKNIYLNLNIF